MKRGSDDNEVVVRRYLLRPPLDWNIEDDAQLRQANALWNALVEIEHGHRERTRAILADDPAVTPLETAMTELRSRKGTLIAEKKQRNRRERRRIDSSDLDAEIARLNAGIKDTVVRLKAARAEARTHLKGALDAAQEERAAAAKTARQAANAEGLWWGNANAVVNSYESARTRAQKDGASLKFHRYTGAGRIVNQIQGGIPASRLFDRKHPHSQVQVAPVDPIAWEAATPRRERERLAITLLSATVFARGRERRRNAQWPMWMDRPIPEDVTVKEVVVTRRKIASHERWAAVFTATRPRIERAAPDGPAVAIDLGWRRVPEGIRVATVLADGAAAPRHILCPERVLAGLDRVDELRRERDEARTAILDRLVALPWREAPPELAELGGRLRAKPASAPDRIALLAIRWRDPDFADARPWRARDNWRPEDFAAIEEWRRWDKRTWETEAHLRDKILAHRLDLYRKAAAEVADRAGALILEEFDIAEAARLEDINAKPTEQAPPMRRYRTVAAPSELRRWLVIQAEKRGVPIVYHHDESNQPHAACGTRHEWHDRTALRQHCPRCAVYYDVDENAARNLLAAFRARGPEAPDSPGALAAE